MLSDSESDTNDTSDHQLTINEHYAKAFQYRKEREELVRLKEKYGSDAEESGEDASTDSESAESEDEDGEELTPAMDAAILRTLARIKRKDPQIYAADHNIFNEEQDKTLETKPRPKVKKDKSKPVTMRQVALESALNPSSRSPSPDGPTFVDEQRALRKETIAAFHATEDSGSEDDLLVPREKTNDELEREEEEYKQFLQRQVGPELEQLVTVDPDTVRVVIDDESPVIGSDKQKKTSKKRSTKEREAEDQEFLMSYILNRGWIDRANKRVPTYGEITRDEPLEEAEEEEEFEDVVDHFESSYNFRFEEPDANVIKTFPRNVTSTVRREENPRKAARERKKERKEEQLLKKKEEVKRLKALKLKDIRQKLDKIGHEGGKDLDNDVLQDLDLEGDWDPDAHDAQMSGLYDNDLEDGGGEKPHWDDDIDIGDIGDIEAEISSKKKKKKKKKQSETNEDEGVDVDTMDADAINDEDDEWDGTEDMRKHKVAKYMEELYSMDFNDMVGDMPTRFKYTPVQSQTYALTPAEILMATDAELNEYMGVKRFAPYRKESRWDPKRAEKLKDLKQKIGSRGDDIGGEDGERPAKKRKGKKERMKLKETAVAVEAPVKGNEVETEASGSKKKRKRSEKP